MNALVRAAVCVNYFYLAVSLSLSTSSEAVGFSY